jgi:arylsulfatase A-like enzyme
MPPNLLVFAIDSLRADHCSAYGYPRRTTPCAERLAAQGVLFRNHYSACIPTRPAYSSILTGHDVMSHRVVSMHPPYKLNPRMETLPQVLKAAGYRSISIGLPVNSFRGFERMEDYEQCWYTWGQRPARKAEKLNEVALPALEELARSGGPWMLFMRHLDPHAPYLPPPPYDTLYYPGDPSDPSLPDTMGPVRNFPPFSAFHLSWMPNGIRDIAHPTAMYDGGVTYMDSCISALLDRLEALGQAEQTLVVFTADHGETLDEHDCYFDHHGLYEPTIHVPLILSQPGRLPEGKTVTATTLHQDLMPTLLEYVGLQEVAATLDMEGVSTLPLISGEHDTHHSGFYLTECTWMRKRGWRTAEWKLIEALEPDFHRKPLVELYDLIADPAENVNLAEQRPEIVVELTEQMRSWVARRLQQTGKTDPILRYSLGVNRCMESVSQAQKLQSRIRNVVKSRIQSRLTVE